MSGSGSARLRFEYAVSEGDADTDGIAIPADTLATPTGSAIRTTTGNRAVQLSHDAVVADAARTVDGVRPTTTTAVAEGLTIEVTWPAIEAREIARAGTHFDIAPTVLEILGLNGYEHHNLGASLLSFESPWLSHDAATTMRAPRALPTMRIAPGEPIAFEDGGRLVRIDGQALVANRHGFALRNQTFMLRFHDDGRFDTALLWRTLDSLRTNEPGALVLGVSTNDRFKRAISAPPDAQAVYFAGRVGGKTDLKER